ncbi:unnamed protein product [Tetraodon nigroviridis]|uniref:(spotted green pufferfish) hypothetical protein n=1 Tax=Tetraodon nigroviridis TaxID=99883 RepID=Q4SIV9_TETNG|nr:unnamed protein product [Tetraodon nigroviridis]
MASIPNWTVRPSGIHPGLNTHKRCIKVQVSLH